LDKAHLTPGSIAEPVGEADRLWGAKGQLQPDEDAKERFISDTAEANGSSIAFLAEYDGRSALFTGDAHARVLETSIRTLLRNRGPDKLTVGACKLPHHGSKYNLGPTLLGLLDTRRFLISTDGTSNSRHPDPVALARIVTTVPNAQLEFNYVTDYNRPWDAERIKHKYGHAVVFPGQDENWLTVRL
jgi:hypothetical protein